MRTNNLLFETCTTGHRMEYIHHLYMMMAEKEDHNYIIVVPEDFETKSTQYEWSRVAHISFDYIPHNKISDVENGGLLTSSYKRTKLLNSYLKKHHADKVFLISLMNFIPFLPLVVSKKVRVCGIIYKIYLYEWSNYSFIRRLIEIVKYIVISFPNCIKTAFILNDSSSAAKLNRLYHTRKFKYLVDPYNEDDYIAHSKRRELGIHEDNAVFFHFGGLSERKGTIKILEAILLIPEEIRSKMTFVFAGLVYDEIRSIFYEMLEKVKGLCQVYVYDEYCTKEFIADLCETCDYILIPYSTTAQSSGVIAYAAKYHKPVIGPQTGLVGKLIRKYKLGIQLKEMTPRSLSEVMKTCSPLYINSSYCEQAKVKVFAEQIGAFF